MSGAFERSRTARLERIYAEIQAKQAEVEELWKSYFAVEEETAAESRRDARYQRIRDERENG